MREAGFPWLEPLRSVTNCHVRTTWSKLPVTTSLLSGDADRPQPLFEVGAKVIELSFATNKDVVEIQIFRQDKFVSHQAILSLEEGTLAFFY